MDRNLPVISLKNVEKAAGEIGKACRDLGFFYINDHGIDTTLIDRLEQQAKKFFALSREEKMKIHMSRGGRAWRGYFPVGEELTSGKPDQKEGIYFGSELAAGHLLPLHGANLFPPGEMRATVLQYIDEMGRLGGRLMKLIAASLGLEHDYFQKLYREDPLVLFRIFNYPSLGRSSDLWSVGEHTDYGFLTILLQDNSGGLEVKSHGSWLAVPPIDGTFVINLGDMLDRLTKGLYKSTPHRVRNVAGRDRLSFPFFYDPSFSARVRPLDLPGVKASDDRSERWDKANVHAFDGTYGDYILAKVSKVFPNLKS